MTECLEETPGGQSRELLRPLHNHHLAVVDADEPDEDIETIYNEVGIEVGEVGDRDEVFEGREAHKSVEGCLERP